MKTQEEILEACRAFQVERVGMFRKIIEAALGFGLRQSEIARCLGVADSTVCRWLRSERMPRKRIQPAYIARLAARLAQPMIVSPLSSFARHLKANRLEHFRQTLELAAKESTRDRS